MKAVLFELVGGGGITIDAEEISALWSGKEPGTTTIDRMGSKTVVVVGEWHKIAVALYDHTDMRPKKKKTKAAASSGERVTQSFGIVDYSLLKKK